MVERIRIPTLPGQEFALPPALDGLGEVALNLWWSWTPTASALFSRVHPTAWARYRNPVPVLLNTTADRWATLVSDEDFMVQASQVIDEFRAYMADQPRRTEGHAGEPQRPAVAYFCAEYGFHESMQIYSGGLGVLAGDHCKSASDAGLPFVAVGLLYRRGYFRQQIDAEGFQEHAQPDLDPNLLPLQRVRAADGSPLTVGIDFPDRQVRALVWVAQVGRVPLLLLDTDISANDPADRPITHILYVRGREMRLCQELVLGIGGVRALRALGIRPRVWHLNEGHSAFMLLERARELLADGFDDAAKALERVGSESVFTIHTPVPAGNEVFDRSLVQKYLGAWSAEAGMDLDRILELGRGLTDEAAPPFDLTAFVLRHAARSNAVSALHGRTASDTWDAVALRPVESITNGVHVGTWTGGPMQQLLERAIGSTLARDLPDGEVAARAAHVADDLLWAAHQQQKRDMLGFVEQRLARQFARHGEPPDELRRLRGQLDPEAFTIGFARRFATYKRAALLFSDFARVAALVSQPDRPIQVIVAGKAHPADRPGQQVIQEIFTLSRSPELRGRVFMLEDYDLQVARFLVAGVDLWLNTPRRPMEASGTSGMKAAINGIPSLSVLDGWWDEGYDGANGWAILATETPDADAAVGAGHPEYMATDESLSSEEAQDAADAAALYDLLERVVVPRFYARDEAGLPTEWLATMRAAITGAIWRFSTARMLGEYVERLYRPVALAAAGGEDREAPRSEAEGRDAIAAREQGAAVA